jgi:hypothetical protein
VEEVARLMEEKQVRRLPVLDRSKRLVGIVSLGDVAVNSQPAFGGIALQEVSLSPEQRMRDHSPRMIRQPSEPRGTRSGTKPATRRKTGGGARTGSRKRTTAGKGRNKRGTSAKRRATTGGRRSRR